MESDLLTDLRMKLLLLKTKKEKKKSLFDTLPNEMLRKVLAKLDTQALITLRGVCKRWKLVSEDICHGKTSLVLMESGSACAQDSFISWLRERFNGLVDFNHNYASAILTVKGNPIHNDDRDELYKHFCLFLAKLFLQVDSLAIQDNWDAFEELVTCKHFPSLLAQWSASIGTLYLPKVVRYLLPPELFNRINQLTGLKRLYFFPIGHLSRYTLAQLEHCPLFASQIEGVAAHLGANLISLNLLDEFTLQEFTRLVQLIGARVLSGNLTHLAISVNKSEEHAVVALIRDHFASLRMLDINFRKSHGFEHTVGSLARLAQLSNLSLSGVDIDMDYLAGLDNLPTLNLVQTFSLDAFAPEDEQARRLEGANFDGDLFCRALATIMPRLVQLTIKHDDQLVRDGILQNLRHFTNLRKHKIVFPDEDD